MTGRFKTPMTTFTNYVKVDPDALGPRITPAALITQEALAHVRAFWKLPEAQAGMYILLHANGNGSLMTESNFKAKFTPAHTTVEKENE